MTFKVGDRVITNARISESIYSEIDWEKVKKVGNIGTVTGLEHLNSIRVKFDDFDHHVMSYAFFSYCFDHYNGQPKKPKRIDEIYLPRF